MALSRLSTAELPNFQVGKCENILVQGQIIDVFTLKNAADNACLKNDAMI